MFELNLGNSRLGNSRFQFVTQLPRGDGCGVAVLQMLTGKTYDEIAHTIGWFDPAVHHMTWDLMRRALIDNGFQVGELRRTKHWTDMEGLSVVHVGPDHFTLYDANTGDFYDPGKPYGPSRETSGIPTSLLPVLI